MNLEFHAKLLDIISNKNKIISDCKLSMRVENALKVNKLDKLTLQELSNLREEKLLQNYSVGRRCLDELNKILIENNLKQIK